MKILKSILVLTIISFIYGCSTSPYLKKEELPNRIQYYSTDKIFSITPNWYWRLRPSDELFETVGFKYLNNKDVSYKNIQVKVIGETVQNNEKYYVAIWESHGYYFIKEKDYLFAKKYEKYLIPLNYDDNKLYENPFRRGGCVNPIELLSEKINSSEVHYYSMNISVRFVNHFKSEGYTIFSTLGINSTGMIQKTEFKNDIEKQIIENRQYSNKFLIIPYNKELNDFLSNSDININFLEFPSKFFGNKQYTNQYGALYNGNVFKAKYVACRWGNTFYAIPCNE